MDIKTLKKHVGEKPHSFSKNTQEQFILDRSCFNVTFVTFVTIAVFKLILKHMKNKHGGEKPHSYSQNTH